MKVNYRKLEIDDLEKIYQLGCETIDHNFMNQLKWEVDNISTLLAQDMSSSFIAHIKKKIIGFIIGKIDKNSKTCNIYWIGALEKYEKYDIISNIFKKLKKEMELKKIKSIRIYVEKENVDLIEKISDIGLTEKKQLLEFG